ncbi:MAG: acyl-CoA dehydrogenase, partial [Alphaproteobacteria bacterium]
AVVTKIATRSLTTAITVMVPNSLGPGELLLHYGTAAQKKHYLPRLAKGLDVPCFALTEPHAGSDAASGRSVGIVCKGKWQGKEIVGIRLTFNKRYITLAPVATVVGLAFKLYDPNHLLGDKEDIGITCALLPRNTKGLNIGQRHDPMGVPFQNGPLSGKDVFVPLDYIIGGQEYAGEGWRMLMECLSTGRGISLPSLSVAGAQLSVRASSAYATVREQFNMPIGKFEGVRERLYRMTVNAYQMDACRTLTAGAVDAGEKPAVASAIAKAYLTEGMRQSINDGMDVQAGGAIIRGPKNIFNRPYIAIPIGITVEGANILTRSLIVFGQGAIRCHPFVQQEVAAIQAGDVKAFDRALFAHFNHIARNAVRAVWLGLTRGALTAAPKTAHMAYFRKLSRYSAAFALIADVGLGTLGGTLKRKEHLSGRFADAFAALYLASSTLKRAHDAGYPAAHVPVVDALLTQTFHDIEQALDDVLRNLPNRLAAGMARVLAFPCGLKAKRPTEKQLEAVVDALMDTSTGLRDMLTHSMYIPTKTEEGLGALEDAFNQTLATRNLRKKMQDAKRRGEEASISAKEHALLTVAEAARDRVIQVDDFSPEAFKGLK